MTRVARFPGFAPFLALLALTACAAERPLEEDLPDMGDFRLGHNIVVADNMRQVPPSRDATPEEWKAILADAIADRFGGYEGDRLYHIGLSVDGYALAPPGIPLILNPRSVLVVSVNVWDDALGEKLHDTPEQVMVFEKSAPETFVVGSGIARSRERQMQHLARNAARRVQLWMLGNPGWFGIDPTAAAQEAAAIEALAEASESGRDAGVPPAVAPGIH